MKILWMTWKDKRHPQAGGAEVVSSELGKRLVQDGHEVTFLVGGFKGGTPEETRDGYRIIRVGSFYTVYLFAIFCYFKHLRGKYDLVIDEINTAPFFARFYVKEKSVIFIHQLAREIWFYQFFFPINIFFYLAEPVYLWMLRKSSVVTVSESTKSDLMRYGFKDNNIHIISEGIELTPVENLDAIQKFEKPTVLALGSVRAMKRALHSVLAFNILKKTVPDAELIIAGDTAGSYGEQVLRAVARSPYARDIKVAGRVSKEQKTELMQKAHVLSVTSVREGWGLVVTEANSQGTPAVVYNVPGLRDSVKHDETGLITTENTPDSLALSLTKILNDQSLYDRLRHAAHTWSRSITFEKSYEDFKNILFGESKFSTFNLEQTSPLVSVIVPTKNSAQFLEACLQSIKNQTYPNIELIVVDNFSTDNTHTIAMQHADHLFLKGPERCAQRNYGASKATGEFILFVDSDMELSSRVVESCVEAMQQTNMKGVIIPEESFGEGFWAQCKRLERSFYVGVDAVEATRFFRKKDFERIGGYCEALVSGEDWHLSDRIEMLGPPTRIPDFIYHNEGRISLLKTLKKKYYYAQKAMDYISQTASIPTSTKRKIGIFGRYFMFFKRPLKLLRNPIVAIGMLFMKTCEFGVGAVAILITNVTYQ